MAALPADKFKPLVFSGSFLIWHGNWVLQSTLEYLQKDIKRAAQRQNPMTKPIGNYNRQDGRSHLPPRR